MRKYNQNEKVKQSKALYFSSFEKLYKSCVSPREQAPERYLYENYNNNIYIRLFKLFPNLITKESYNWWVTRRVWGFRHQISKAKYLKMSVANIGKLQENTAALCKKISQNVGRTYREASGEHRITVQNGCETLWISTIKGFGYVWPGKLKHPPLPSGGRRRMRNIRMECQRRRIPDVRHPGGMSAQQNSGCKTSGWNVGATEFRM